MISGAIKMQVRTPSGYAYFAFFDNPAKIMSTFFFLSLVLAFYDSMF
jgi:hypothetical protein